MSEPEFSKPTHSDVSVGHVIDADECYERGLALRKAGLFKPSIEQFEKATANPVYALKAYAHMGLSYKSCNQYVQAVEAFRKALSSPGASTKDIVQILYVLGRTLESLGRIAEALEAYRWIRREDPGYRDVANRINPLSSRRSPAGPQKSATSQSGSWIGDMLKSWQGLLKSSK
jgi:tetratricopeptide (TPR) repeat protein